VFCIPRGNIPVLAKIRPLILMVQLLLLYVRQTPLLKDNKYYYHTRHARVVRHPWTVCGIATTYYPLTGIVDKKGKEKRGIDYGM